MTVVSRRVPYHTCHSLQQVCLIPLKKTNKQRLTGSQINHSSEFYSPKVSHQLGSHSHIEYGAWVHEKEERLSTLEMESNLWYCSRVDFVDYIAEHKSISKAESEFFFRGLPWK
jgi:hypothetical protein